MGHQDDGHPFLFIEPAEQFQDLFAGVGVKVAGGLVGKEDGGIIDQSPGDGHPLLLAAGELRGFVIQAPLQTDPVEQIFGPLAGLPVGEVRRGIGQGHDDVVQGAGAGQQIEGLEHEADLFVAQLGPGIGIQGGDVLAVQPEFSGGGPVEAAQDVHQGGLARTRGAHEGEELAP